jgi:uncharacterized protein (DUF934 family)
MHCIMDLPLSRSHVIPPGWESSTAHSRSSGSGWRLLETSPWLQVGEDGFVPDFPLNGPLIVPLKLWQLRREDLVGRNEPLGVLLQPIDDPAAIASDLTHFALIVTPFPRFTEDRADSTARRLREHYGYRGELRSIDVPCGQAVMP